MSVPFDGDMVVFLWVNLKTILGTKQRLRESTRRIPMKFAFQEIPAEKLTQAQKDYMKPIDDQLAALNYFPLATFRVTNFNFATNLLRRYSNPADPVSCALTVVEVKVKVGEVESVRNAWSVEFASRFAGGRKLITRNNPQKSLFDPPPLANQSGLSQRYEPRRTEAQA